ncbi:MAG: nucleotidyltransferase domain-containing protein [Burkholderiales bacterium]|nr:nucleotidyltransferase domain-containing protein [Burkholderiales bacterium]
MFEVPEVAKAGGISALRQAGNPADVVRETKDRMFAALLAIRHIEQGLGIPPVRFQTLVQLVAPARIRPAISNLLELKARTSELGLGDPIPEIGEFLETELERHAVAYSGQGRPDRLAGGSNLRDQMNNVFRSVIAESTQVPPV